MLPDLIHAGAALVAFGGYAGSMWAGLRTRKAAWLIPAAFFLLACAFMAAWH